MSVSKLNLTGKETCLISVLNKCRAKGNNRAKQYYKGVCSSATWVSLAFGWAGNAWYLGAHGTSYLCTVISRLQQQAHGTIVVGSLNRYVTSHPNAAPGTAPFPYSSTLPACPSTLSHAYQPVKTPSSIWCDRGFASVNTFRVFQSNLKADIQLGYRIPYYQQTPPLFPPR